MDAATVTLLMVLELPGSLNPLLIRSAMSNSVVVKASYAY